MITTTISYIVKPLENGFTVEHSYKEHEPIKHDYDGYSYKSKKYIFADWAGVIDWIAANPVAVPQQD